MAEEQISAQYTYEYPRPAVATDSVVFGYNGYQLKILLIERKIEPYKGKLALPGGFVRENETAEECAVRELQEETQLTNVKLHQFHTFSRVDRDERGRVISIAYFGLSSTCGVMGGTDAQSAHWYTLQIPSDEELNSSNKKICAVDHKGNELPVAFDHQEIIEEAYKSLQRYIYFYPIGFDLLPKYFAMPQLQRLYELILNKEFERRNFITKMVKKTKIVKELIQKTNDNDLSFACSSKIRPHKFYYFDAERYEQLMEEKKIKIEF